MDVTSFLDNLFCIFERKDVYYHRSAIIIVTISNKSLMDNTQILNLHHPSLRRRQRGAQRPEMRHRLCLLHLKRLELLL